MTVSADLPPLDQFYAPLEGDGELVIAQLGQSLDGFIASRTGDAQFVTGEADRTHLHVLRSLVDVVVVGAATVIADDCRLTVRHVEPRGGQPWRAVVDPRGRVPLTCHLFTDGAAPTFWLVGRRAELPADIPAGVEVVRLDADTAIEPRQVLAELRERGLGRVLVEGGGRLVSAFVAAGVVDRLYVTTAPLLIGDGIPGLRFSGRDALSDALRGPSRRRMLGEDVCTEMVLRP